MATAYYIRNRKKYDEYRKLQDFWESLIKKTKKSIEDFCRETDGAFVNSDLAEDIIDDKFGQFSYPPIYEDEYDTEIAICGNDGLRFTYLNTWQKCVDDTDEYIKSTDDVIRFFKRQDAAEYAIVDEYGNEISVDDFIKLGRQN